MNPFCFPFMFDWNHVWFKQVGPTTIWDLTVLGWEIKYKEEFVPSDEGSYTVIIQKGKKISSNEAPIRNSFRNNEPGNVVLTIANGSSKKKRILYRYKTKKNCSSWGPLNINYLFLLRFFGLEICEEDSEERSERRVMYFFCSNHSF